jgi:hypothetical protein
VVLDIINKPKADECEHETSSLPNPSIIKHEDTIKTLKASLMEKEKIEKKQEKTRKSNQRTKRTNQKSGRKD